MRGPQQLKRPLLYRMYDVTQSAAAAAAAVLNNDTQTITTSDRHIRPTQWLTQSRLSKTVLQSESSARAYHAWSTSINYVKRYGSVKLRRNGYHGSCLTPFQVQSWTILRLFRPSEAALTLACHLSGRSWCSTSVCSLPEPRYLRDCSDCANVR